MKNLYVGKYIYTKESEGECGAKYACVTFN